MTATAAIPLNAFSSLTVHGLVIENGSPISQTFTRGVVRPGQQISMLVKSVIRPGGIPKRPPSSLPPPGTLQLEIKLGQRIGDGRVGCVYDAIVINPQVTLPPLVLKISRPKKTKNLSKEAWFYEELEQLQGISVPRCYGFFQTRLMPDSKVITWRRKRYADLELDNEDGEREGQEDGDDGSEYDEGESESEENLDYEDDEEGELEENSVDDERREEKNALDDGVIRGVEDNRKEKDFDESEGRYLSILVLEKLGGRMPVGVPLDDSIEKDVYEIFDDISYLGIETLDIRWSNILLADEQSAADQPVCPHHGHRHKWRLVDFDHARKTDGTMKLFRASHGCYIERLLRNIVTGYIIEPWE